MSNMANCCPSKHGDSCNFFLNKKKLLYTSHRIFFCRRRAKIRKKIKIKCWIEKTEREREERERERDRESVCVWGWKKKTRKAGGGRICLCDASPMVVVA